MKKYNEMSPVELKKEYDIVKQRYDELCKKGLKLDMSRGKPGPDQLSVSNELFGLVTADDYKSADGIDCRNYGGVDGLLELKKLFAGMREFKRELEEMFNVKLPELSMGMSNDYELALEEGATMIRVGRKLFK